ncbi:ABC-type nitrate/sulfonate/bicarbonate transport system substrate-binding protein [Gracilibacillus alcaliphilus]|nr:ABC-type nitrate/sulfonate/bicarbonate transport system substrate-binding protein [Gracilibacillus alcaliphilus]
MFEQGQIEAAAAPEPWGTYLVEELNAHVITEWDDVF